MLDTYEIREDYAEQAKEKALAARVPAVSKKGRIISEREAHKLDGPCITVKPALPNLPSFGGRVRYLRGIKTQMEFAEVCGLCGRTINRCEKPGWKVREGTVKLIAKACDVPLDWLLKNAPYGELEAAKPAQQEVTAPKVDAMPEPERANVPKAQEIATPLLPEPVKQDGIALNICGEYNAELVAQILQGFAGQKVRVKLEVAL